MYDSHSGIVNIIPEIANDQSITKSKTASIDLEKSMEELFVQYFEHKHAQRPNEDIMNLLKEVMSTDKSDSK